MSKLSEKMKYIAVGAMIACAVFLLGSLDNDIGAQFESGRFDELIVRKLIVREEILFVDVDQNPQITIYTRGKHRGITIYGPEESDAMIGIGVNENGGHVGVSRALNGSADISVNKDGGNLTLTSNKDAKILLSTNEGKGRITLLSKPLRTRVLEP